MLPPYRFSQDSQEIYIEAIKSMTQNELTTLYVDYQHVLTYSVQLATSIQKEYYRLKIWASPLYLNTAQV